jgi:hypothetical protein
MPDSVTSSETGVQGIAQLQRFEAICTREVNHLGRLTGPSTVAASDEVNNEVPSSYRAKERLFPQVPRRYGCTELSLSHTKRLH